MLFTTQFSTILTSNLRYLHQQLSWRDNLLPVHMTDNREGCEIPRIEFLVNSENDTDLAPNQGHLHTNYQEFASKYGSSSFMRDHIANS